MSQLWLQKIRLKHLSALLSLGRTLNLTRTAAELNMHQSGLSKMLIDIEADLGFQLFDRRGRGLVLNDAGRAALDHAARVHAAMHNFGEEMEVIAQKGRGLISVGLTGFTSSHALPAALLSMIQKEPDIHIRIIEAAADPLVDRLSSGEIDFMIGPGNLQFEGDPTIREEPLYAERICTATRAGHPLAGKTGVSWDDMTEFPLVVWAPGTPIRRALDISLAAHGWKLPTTFVESNSAAINMNLILNSDMIGFSMRLGAETYRALGVLDILDIDLAASGTVSLYWRETDLERKIVAAARSRVIGLAQTRADDTQVFDPRV